MKPSVVYHADWGSKEEKRWCARATLGADDCYTAFAPQPVGSLASLIGRLRADAGGTRCPLAGFDYPIGIPAFYAKRAGTSSFRALLTELGRNDRKAFYSVCDESGEKSVHRPFYPDGAYKCQQKEDLFRGHGVAGRQWA